VGFWTGAGIVAAGGFAAGVVQTGTLQGGVYGALYSMKGWITTPLHFLTEVISRTAKSDRSLALGRYASKLCART